MRPHSLLRRTATATIVAAGLLVVPPVALTAPSASAACAGACAPDTDGDGLADANDGCPTVAAATSTGCPTAARKASLKWKAGQRRLQATITSPVTSCASRARIKLWRVRPHQDSKVAAVDASWGGRRRFSVARGGTYYVTVSSSYSSGEAECRTAVSRTVRVPRR